MELGDEGIRRKRNRSVEHGLTVFLSQEHQPQRTFLRACRSRILGRVGIDAVAEVFQRGLRLAALLRTADEDILAMWCLS